MGMGGQRHAPAALPPGKTRYALCRRLDGHQGRSGRVRSPDGRVRSDSLHRLSYPGPLDHHTSDQWSWTPVNHDIMGTNITRVGELPKVCNIPDMETPDNLNYKALCRVSWISVRQSEWDWQPITKDVSSAFLGQIWHAKNLCWKCSVLFWSIYLANNKNMGLWNHDAVCMKPLQAADLFPPKLTSIISLWKTTSRHPSIISLNL